MGLQLGLSLLVLGFVTTVMSQSIVYREDATTTNSQQTVSLGGLFPVRRSSNGECTVVRESAVEHAEAMVFAIRTINADPSLLPDVNLTFQIRDTCSLTSVALEETLEYVQSSGVSCSNLTTLAVSGVLGAARSSVTTTVATLLGLFQLPQISYASTAAVLSDSSEFNYFFRTIPSDSFQAQAMADIIVHFNWTYIFALHSSDTYGREGIDSLIAALDSKNGSQSCIALRMALPIGKASNDTYDNVVESMSRQWVRNASVVVLFGHSDGAIGMIRAVARAANSASALQDITWIASDSWALALPEEYHPMATGMLSILPQQGNVEGFTNHFLGLNPRNNGTTNPWFNDYWESRFDCELGGADGICENQNLSSILASQASYIQDAVNAFAHALHQMIVDHCPNGTICDKIITRRSAGEAINGILLREYLFNVSFVSTFSEVPNERLFDDNGDVQGSYQIFNLQFIDDQSSFEPVGTWDNIDLLQLTGPIQWVGGSEEAPQSVCSLPCGAGHQPRRLPDQAQCCFECSTCLGENSASSGEECFECPERHMPNPERNGCLEIPVTFFTASNPWAIVVLILACAGIATSVFVAVMFAVFHKKKVIKASSRELSAILLGGILLCYILPFLFVLRPSPALCGVRRFAIGFCFAISYSALLVRSNRIHRIFNQPHIKVKPPRFIGSVSQVVITCLLISVQVLIAVVWLAVEHPSVEIVQVNSRTVELRCGESPYFGLPVSLFYNLLLLVFSTYFAFRTRKVPDNFNEAKFINVTLYSLGIIWLGFLPAYFVSIQFGTVYENFFLLLAIILSASVTLLCLLVPKIFIVFLGMDKKKNVTSGALPSNQYTNHNKRAQSSSL